MTIRLVGEILVDEELTEIDRGEWNESVGR